MLPVLSAHRIGLLHRNGLKEARAVVGQSRRFEASSGPVSTPRVLPGIGVHPRVGQQSAYPLLSAAAYRYAKLPA